MAALTVIENENDLLLNFLDGNAVAIERFVEIMEARILRTARRIGRDLPDDIAEEIAQQTFANLLSISTTDFDPSRGTARQFLIGKIWNAEKRVRRSYGYPPRIKKQNAQAGDPASTAPLPTFVSIDAEGMPEIPTPNFQPLFEGEVYVQTVIRRAPQPLASALRLICYENKTKDEAAKITGLSRYQLHRQIAGFRQQLQRAA